MHSARRARVTPDSSHHSSLLHTTSGEPGVAASERCPLQVFSRTCQIFRPSDERGLGTRRCHHHHGVPAGVALGTKTKPAFRTAGPGGVPVRHRASDQLSQNESRLSKHVLRAVPFPVALPATPPKRRDLPDDGSRRCASPVPFVSILKGKPAFRTTAGGGCPSPLRVGELPQTGVRSSAQRVRTDALRHCSSDRFRSGVVADTGTPRLPCPRRLHESETSSRPRLLAVPSAHHTHHVCGARLAPHPGSAAGAATARVAIDPHRASRTTGCSECSHPRPLLAQRSSHWHKVPA
jgi:hypothetical protein